ncbi:MAG: transporter [Verrucomicrobia bacterium]|nr:transporter [Verrucomicrobiota bacterium]
MNNTNHSCQGHSRPAHPGAPRGFERPGSGDRATRRFSSLLVAVILTGALNAADKGQYTLLNPTPDEQMRPLSTDRPDKTESAYTLDAGHFLVEADFFTYAYDRHNVDRSNTKVETWNVAPVNLKVGLLNNVDLQLILTPYTSIRRTDHTTGTVGRQEGFNDLILRSKINVWGNDDGRTALALMPVVKIPTNQDNLGNGSVEGGLIVPMAVALPGNWGMGLMTEVDIVRDEVGGSYHPEFINTITFGHSIVGNLGGYLEFFALVNEQDTSNWEGTVDLGLTYAINENIQLDGGVNIGVTRAADDWNPFVGISWRF